MDAAELAHRFEYHPARDIDTQDRHQAVRRTCSTSAALLNTVLPEGREKSLAMTKLEEAMMWANAAIARETTPVADVERTITELREERDRAVQAFNAQTQALLGTQERLRQEREARERFGELLLNESTIDPDDYRILPHLG